MSARLALEYSCAFTDAVMARSKALPARKGSSSSGVTNTGPRLVAKSLPLAGPRLSVICPAWRGVGDGCPQDHFGEAHHLGRPRSRLPCGGVEVSQLLQQRYPLGQTTHMVALDEPDAVDERAGMSIGGPAHGRLCWLVHAPH